MQKDDETHIRGFVWNDENRNGVFERDVERGMPGASVSLFCSADATQPWALVADTATEPNGGYTFADEQGEKSFDAKKYYYIAFENPHPESMEFTAWRGGDPSGYSLESHVSQATPDNTIGMTDPLSPILFLGTECCYVNAGIHESPSVVYTPGASDDVRGIPHNEKARSGSLYTVKGDAPVPTREGYEFAGWSVVTSSYDRDGKYLPGFAYASDMPAQGDEYKAGDRFSMLQGVVVLEARWRDAKER